MKDIEDLLFKPAPLYPHCARPRKDLSKVGGPAAYRYWINFSDEQDLPTYDEVVAALLVFDEVVVAADDHRDFTHWISSSALIRELFAHDLIFYMFTFADSGADVDALLDADIAVGRKVLETGYFWSSDYGLSAEEIDKIRQFFWNREALGDQHAGWLHNRVDFFRTAINYGLVANVDAFLFEILGFNPLRSSIERISEHGNLRQSLLATFDIPVPVSPRPDEVMKFREAGAHVALRSFVERMHQLQEGYAAAGESLRLPIGIQHLILDAVHDSFRESSRRRDFVSLGRSLAGTVLDLGLAAFGVPAPLGSGVAMIKDALDIRNPSEEPTAIWRSFFSEWVNSRGEERRRTSFLRFCSATTKNGKRCSRRASAGGAFCDQHSRKPRTGFYGLLL